MVSKRENAVGSLGTGNGDALSIAAVTERSNTALPLDLVKVTDKTVPSARKRMCTLQVSVESTPGGTIQCAAIVRFR